MSGENEIGPLTWVKGEIDLAMERAGEALHAASKSPQALEQFKHAQNHLHQAHGALLMVGLEGVSQVTDAIERLLAVLEQRLQQRDYLIGGQGVETAGPDPRGLVSRSNYL